MVQTLFIGLDGATFTILDHLTTDVDGQGVVMPFTRHIFETGFRAPLRSTPNPLTPPAWMALMTGRSPGHHGVYDFIRYKDMGHEMFMTLYDFRDCRVETLWSVASRQGKSVASLNFPMMAPPPEINGSMIPGFVSWKHLRRNCTPSAVYERASRLPNFSAKEIAWDFEREMAIGFEMPPDELEAWIRDHLPREDHWFRIAEMLGREDNPDLLAVLFDGVDKFQHQAWAYLDPSLMPASPDDSYWRIRRLLLDYFRQVDGYIEQLTALAGPDAQLFLASDHGFTTDVEIVRINRYLGELGYLVWHEVGDSEAEKRREASHFAYLDWEKTTAFCPTPSCNGICIRVSDGNGKPGIRPEAYPAFREKLIADLYALRDGESDEPVIRNIMLREDVFPGAACQEAPDLTLTLRNHGFVSVRNRQPVVEKRAVPCGTHHPDGVFLALGKGVESGYGELMSILDVPSILIHSLGLPVPEDWEGQVPETLYTADHLMRHPVRVGPATVASAERAGISAEAEELSDAEKEKMLQQLRALGYLED